MNNFPISFLSVGYLVLLICGALTIFGKEYYFFSTMGTGVIIFILSFVLDRPGAVWQMCCDFGNAFFEFCRFISD